MMNSGGSSKHSKASRIEAIWCNIFTGAPKRKGSLEVKPGGSGRYRNLMCGIESKLGLGLEPAKRQLHDRRVKGKRTIVAYQRRLKPMVCKRFCVVHHPWTAADVT